MGWGLEENRLARSAESSNRRERMRENLDKVTLDDYLKSLAHTESRKEELKELVQYGRVRGVFTLYQHFNLKHDLLFCRLVGRLLL